MKTYKDVESYISDQPADVQKMLKKLRTTVKKAAPMAEERISYGMPNYTFNGSLIFFGAFKKHIGLFPGPAAIKKFAKELKGYKTSKGTVQLPLDEPLPLELVSEITKFKVVENLSK